MNEALQFIIEFAPFVAAALVFGLGLAIAAPWLWKNPDRWLFLAIFALSLPAISQNDGANTVKQGSWSLIFALGTIQLIRHEHGRLSFDRINLPLGLVVLIGFICLSVTWSPHWSISMLRLIQIIGVIVIAQLVARHALQGRGLLTQMLVPAGLFLLLGLAVTVVSPATGFDQDHCMRGIAAHKNTWGQFSLLCGLIFLSSLSERHSPRWMAIIIAMLSISAISIVLSRSTTSLLCFLFIAGTLMLWMILTRGGNAGKILIATILALLLISIHIYFITYGELPFETLRTLIYTSTGKNETLTGRDFLWYLIEQEIHRHPWLGTGYGGFWTGTDGASAALVSRLDWGPPTQAHSGYLDTINEVGFVGLGLLFIMLLTHVVNVAQLSQRGEYQHAFLHGSVLIAMLFINYAETSFLRTTHFWWIVLCISIVEAHVRLRYPPEAERLAVQANRPPYTLHASH